jgi:hypothetical protein
VTQYKKVTNSCRFNAIDRQNFGCDFPTGLKKAAVFGVVDPLSVFFHHSHTQKALPLVKTRRLSHQPSTIKIGSGFRLANSHKKKKGRDG